jgi:hypothetical protein
MRKIILHAAPFVIRLRFSSKDEVVKPALTILKLESSPPVIAEAFRCTACPATATYLLGVRRLAETKPLRQWQLCEQHAVQFGKLMAALRADYEVMR